MKKIQGFTLVELLIAIAIFALLSALGWKVFDQLIRVKERNAVHEKQLFMLQDAYQQFLRDSLQVIPASSQINSEPEAAINLNQQVFALSKAGVSDPLKKGLSPYERIEYRFDANKKVLYRLKYANLNASAQTQPLSSIVLQNVDDFKVEVLNPNILAQWPESGVDLTQNNNLKKLPKGFKVSFKINDTQYEWLYSLLNTSVVSSQSN